uniref:Uncharacterized protein n=1 Tax=Tanacetum cinerariifolium TaxID=118510 RepID=A0A6L2N691_TANCI|nr:hypothetical protein [Tanacetum cinerariifolium]
MVTHLELEAGSNTCNFDTRLSISSSLFLEALVRRLDMLDFRCTLLFEVICHLEDTFFLLELEAGSNACNFNTRLSRSPSLLLEILVLRLEMIDFGFSSEERVYYSFDEAKDDTNNLYPMEFLNHST